MLGVIITMFCKNNKVKQIGEVVLGFGVLFMGLSLMSGSMEGMKESPFAVDLLLRYHNPVFGISLDLLSQQLYRVPLLQSVLYF